MSADPQELIDEGIAAEFDAFWAAYPRRIDKKRARAAYAAARKRAPAAVILAGAKRLRGEGREQQFTPHPTTWLRGDRWDDEPLASVHHLDGHRERSTPVGKGWGGPNVPNTWAPPVHDDHLVGAPS